MNNIKENNIDNIYLMLCNELVNHGNIVSDTKELNNVCFTLTDINKNIVSIRDISPSYLFGEWLWYFNGCNKVNFISQFGRMWDRLSDDKITNNSAYGYLIKYAFNFNQVDKIIELLQKDNTSRRAVINLNTPNKNVIKTHDEPCTIALQFYIRDNKLNCTGMMRSNDIWFGLPYDIPFFTELQKYIANKLNIDYGTYTHFVVSLHMYNKNEKTIKEIIKNPISKPIIFSREKFQENKNIVYHLIYRDINNQMLRKDIQNHLLELAKEYFDYKGE